MKNYVFLLTLFLYASANASPVNDSCYQYYLRARNLLIAYKNAESIAVSDSSLTKGCYYAPIYNIRGAALMTLTFVNDDTNNVKAIRFFDKALLLDSLNADIYNNRGWAKQNLNKYRAALDDFRKAVQLDSSNADLQGNVLRVLWIMNRNKEAYAYAEKLIAMFPTDGYAYYVRGNLKRDWKHKYPEGNIDIKKSELLKWNGGMRLEY